MLTGVTQMYLESEMALDGSLFDPEYRLFLSFVLEHDYYGIPIEYITEVKSWADVKIRPLVKAPDFLLGVFNLRGNIVPVVDLRKKWDCVHQEFDSRTASRLANESAEVARDGGLTMNDVVSAMTSMRSSSERVPAVDSAPGWCGVP